MDIPFKTNISICFCHLDRAVLVNWLEGGSVRDPLYLILVTLSYFFIKASLPAYSPSTCCSWTCDPDPYYEESLGLLRVNDPKPSL